MCQRQKEARNSTRFRIKNEERGTKFYTNKKWRNKYEILHVNKKMTMRGMKFYTFYRQKMTKEMRNYTIPSSPDSIRKARESHLIDEEKSQTLEPQRLMEWTNRMKFSLVYWCIPILKFFILLLLCISRQSFLIVYHLNSISFIIIIF